MRPIEKSTSDFLKAILPFGIIATHYLPLYGYNTLYLGEIIVAIFFFLSGYGLSMSKKKVTIYLFMQRITKLLIPFAISILIFQSVTFVLGDLAILRITSCDNFTDAIGMILPNSWFVYSIVLFYTFFHITSHFVKSKVIKFIVLFLVMMLYIKLMAKYVPGEHWHITSFAFFSGTLYKEIQTERIKPQQTIVYLFLMFTTILISFQLNFFYSRLIFYAMTPLFICSMVSFCNFSRNKIILFFHIHYPMYLLHGITIYIYIVNFI